jgi:uncharacterized protein (TIGR00251 family)
VVKLTAKDDSVVFAVRVQPRASRTGVAGELDGALKVRLAAPPVDGEANEELTAALAKLFHVSRRRVEIISGQTSKNKLIRITGVSADLCEKALKEALEGQG